MSTKTKNKKWDEELKKYILSKDPLISELKLLISLNEFNYLLNQFLSKEFHGILMHTDVIFFPISMKHQETSNLIGFLKNSCQFCITV